MNDDIKPRGGNPPAGMVVLNDGLFVRRGDWFFIESWGAWTPVPESAIGQRICGAKVARNSSALGSPNVKDEPRP